MTHCGMHKHSCTINKQTTMIWCYSCDSELVANTEDDYSELLDSYRRSCSVAKVRSPGRSTVTPTSNTAMPLEKLPSQRETAVIKFTPPSGKKLEDGRTPLSFTYPVQAGLTGLQNLGNTCFLNATLQALSNIPQLSTFFTECSFISQQAKSDSLASGFRLLMLDMWFRSHVGVTDTAELPWVAPSAVFRTLRRANPIFEGYQQHDAHEALRTILNEIHEKLSVEVPVSLYDFTEHKSESQTRWYSSQAKPSAKSAAVDSDDSDADKVHIRGSSSTRRKQSEEKPLYTPPPGRKWLVDGPYTGPETVPRSIVSDLFQGVYCSRVRCKSCGTDSLTYDTFYDLSLPIPRSHHPVARGSDGSTHPARAQTWSTQGTEAGDVDTYPDNFDTALMSPSTAAASTVPNAMRKPLDGFSTPTSPTSTATPVPVASAAGDEGSAEEGGWFWNTIGKVFCSRGGGGRAFGFGDSIGLADCLYTFFDWYVAAKEASVSFYFTCSHFMECTFAGRN